jgi:hypothetical protein
MLDCSLVSREIFGPHKISIMHILKELGLLPSSSRYLVLWTMKFFRLPSRVNQGGLKLWLCLGTKNCPIPISLVDIPDTASNSETQYKEFLVPILFTGPNGDISRSKSLLTTSGPKETCNMLLFISK